MNDELAAQDAVTEEAARILEDAAIRQSRTFYLNRRLWLSLYDLGLLDLVGRDWVTPGEEVFEFKALDLKTVDRIVCRLQDLAAGRRDPVGRPGPGQLGFDFEPQPAPVAVIGSTLHLGGGR